MQQPRKIVPPVYLIGSLLLMYLLQRWLPLMTLDAGPLLWGFGAGLVSAGLAVIGVALGLFVKADTAIVPFHKSSAVVTTGPYKITRNPMYLGMVLIL